MIFHLTCLLWSSAGMQECCIEFCHRHYTCPCLWVFLYQECHKVLTGHVGMLSVLFTDGCSSTRKVTNPQTRQSAPSSVKWKEWATPMWMEPRESGMWPITSSLRRLVTGLAEGPKACWNVKRVYHMTPNWSVICCPSGACHRPVLTGLW